MQLTTRLGLKLYQLLRGAVAAAGGSTLLNNLEHYWSLDEQSGTRADEVGSADLTDNNTVTAVNRGPLGTVANFTKANSENLSVTAPAVFAAGTARTVAFWFYATADAGSPGLFSVGSTPTAQERCSIWYGGSSPNKTLALWHDGTFGSSAGFFSINEWHFLVYEYSGSGTHTIWVDGTSRYTVSDSDSGTATNFYLGAAAAGEYADARLSRAGVWSRALGATDRNTLFNSGNGKAYDDLTTAEKVGLVSYWDLTESSGTRADSHGSNNLTDNNTVTSVINAGDAMDGAAASFVGANSEALSVTPAPDLGAADHDYTVSVWVKASSLSGENAIVALPYATAIRGLVYFNDANLLHIHRGGGVTWDTALTTSTWYHIVAWYDAALSKVYLSVNGAAAQEAAAADSEDPSTDEFCIGAYNAHNAGLFDGQIDEVALWSRVLTSDERTELYNLGAGKYYDFS